ncbi:methyltransferase domain-containing protein [Sarocladium implicatum]|nr:methyltransferase domain-containing protein [Sarocladium implicatum]
MADSSASHPNHLEPSKLGTKEYWDSLYTTEISNHAANPSDTGTVWFSDSNAEAKILSHLSSLTKTPSSSTPDTSASPAQVKLSRETTSFLDLGCGNGSLLLALRAASWKGPMLGVDYSPQSVQLAQQVAADEQVVGDKLVYFEEYDILNGDPATILNHQDLPASVGEGGGFDVVLDKGTFDAISLSDEKDVKGRRLCEGYRESVLPLVKKGTGLFVLTSCNWTEEELKSWFVAKGQEEDGDGFEVASRVEYRTFSFGGVKGQTISTLCFRRTG